MIVPRFKLSQTSDSVTITIWATYYHLQEVEVNVDENTFIFSCKPYYLQLRLPGTIQENERSKSTVKVETGEFQFTYEKTIPGEEFQDLDLITKFLCSKAKRLHTPVLKLGGAQHYGFAMRGHVDFEAVCSEFMHLFEVNPTEVKLMDRRAMRLRIEQRKFSIDHYLFDLADEEGAVKEVLLQTAPWKTMTDVQFTPDEMDFLKDLPNREYDLSPTEITYCHNGLLDILFAYCYDRRTTYYEGTCESGWTISKLSATLSCFDAFTETREVIISSFRRCLTYPLYRNYSLAMKVFEDLKSLLGLKEKFLVKCLIEIRKIFLESEYYVLNRLFIGDYILYVMQWDKSLWEARLAALHEVSITKECLGLNLPIVEEVMIDDLTKGVSELSCCSSEVSNF